MTFLIISIIYFSSFKKKKNSYSSEVKLTKKEAMYFS